MKEYIERAAVHELVKRLPKYQMFNYDRTKSLIGINPDDVDFGVDKIPTADVTPVRHGRWNNINPTVLNPGINWVCRCSLCGCPQDYKHNYCPNCGARMGKEDEHEAG